MTNDKSTAYQSVYHDDIPNVVTAPCQNQHACDDETELLSEYSHVEHESAVEGLNHFECKKFKYFYLHISKFCYLHFHKIFM